MVINDNIFVTIFASQKLYNLNCFLAFVKHFVFEALNVVGYIAIPKTLDASFIFKLVVTVFVTIQNV